MLVWPPELLNRLQAWLAMLRSHEIGERIFLEWNGRTWRVIDDADDDPRAGFVQPGAALDPPF